MASREEIYAAIRNADKAGDVASVQKLAAYLQTMDAAPPPAAPAQPSGATDKIKQGAVNIAAGGVRGAGSIGATLVDSARSLGDDVTAATPPGMRPDITAGNASLPRGREIRAGMDADLKDLTGANPDSLLFKGGKLAGEVAGTAGVAGLVGNTARAAGAAPALADAISSGGMAGGGNMLTRILGGAVSGGATAGLNDPKEAGMGVLFGASLPPVVKVAGMAGNALADLAQTGSRRLMQSAIKPTIAQRASGDADTAINTLLQYGINPTKGGVNKLRELIDDLNSQISGAVGSSTATVDKAAVLNRLSGTRSAFGNQVSPTSDLAAIQGIADDFLAHPTYPGATLPVQAAQDLKQGTYRALSKKYGEVGGAATEAQKALARGLKEEIATAVPAVGPLNAEESKLLTTLSVAERRALLEANKNPLGLAAALVHDPAAFAAFMADKSALFKSLMARAVNASTPAQGTASQKLLGVASNPLLRSAGVVANEANP